MLFYDLKDRSMCVIVYLSSEEAKIRKNINTWAWKLNF